MATLSITLRDPMAVLRHMYPNPRVWRAGNRCSQHSWPKLIVLILDVDTCAGFCQSIQRRCAGVTARFVVVEDHDTRLLPATSAIYDMAVANLGAKFDTIVYEVASVVIKR